MRRNSPRRGFTLLELLIVILIIGFLAAIATPGHGCYRPRANKRACFANQKTIAGAIEMYNLDFNTNVTRITPELREQLEEQGYLQQYPNDPGGQGEYRMFPLFGNGVYCTEHGPIQGPRPSAWQMLRQRKLEPELQRFGAAGLDWLIRDLREGAEAELQRARYQGAAVGALLGLGVPATIYLLFYILLPPIRRVWSTKPEAHAAAPTGTLGILTVLATRGLAEPWPTASPDARAACPVCAEGFHAEQPQAEGCPRCLAPHHPECREFNRGCGIYACGQR